MSTTTPRVGFYMPADDGSEPVNVATDLNDNLEKMDTAVGFVPTTAAGTPTNLYDGKGAYETDTGSAKFRSSSTWTYLLTAGAEFLSNLWLGVGQKIGMGTSTPTAAVEIAVSNITTDNTAVKFRQSSDANPRMRVDADGIRMGPGTATTDVAIYRPTANQLAITGSVSMASNLAVSGDVSASSLSISDDLDIGGNIISDVFITGKLYGTGTNVGNFIRKTTDATRTSTITPTDDTELTFNVEANSIYFVQTYLVYSGNTTGDFRYAWTIPAGAGGLRWVLGEASAQTDHATATMRTSVHVVTTEVVFGAHSTSAFTGAMDTLVLTTAGTAGAVTLKFAQGTSDATATTLRTGTMLVYRKVA